MKSIRKETPTKMEGLEVVYPKTLKEMAERPAPWNGLKSVYTIVQENFDEIQTARKNGWDWRAILRVLGLPPTENGSIASAFWSIRRKKSMEKKAP